MPESASGLMTEVAALTHATTQLLNTVNVRKATLDASVDAAAGSATSAASSAQFASQSAASAATTLDETEGFVGRLLRLLGLGACGGGG